MTKFLKLIYLMFVLFPIAIFYSTIIMVYTILEYIIEKSKIR